jgi:hypothetical protein
MQFGIVCGAGDAEMSVVMTVYMLLSSSMNGMTISFECDISMPQTVLPVRHSYP